MGCSTSSIAVWSCGRLAARVLATDAGRERRIGYGDRLGMLVGSVMLFSMDLFMLLEVLGTLERFLANLADVRLERCVDWGSVSWTSEQGKKKKKYL
jgi:hypothetical protein